MTAPARAATLVAAASLAVALAGCSGGQQPDADPTASVTPGAVTWSPCDGLTADEVGRWAGQRVREDDGTSDSPRCAFVPVVKGGPAFEVNYLWFDGGLSRAWRTMGKIAGQVSEIRVPGADSARLVVNRKPSAILVSGFVQVGGLVQSVNAAQLRPYDAPTVLGTTRHLLAALVRKAPDQPSGSS